MLIPKAKLFVVRKPLPGCARNQVPFLLSINLVFFRALSNVTIKSHCLITKYAV